MTSAYSLISAFTNAACSHSWRNLLSSESGIVMIMLRASDRAMRRHLLSAPLTSSAPASIDEDRLLTTNDDWASST